MGMYTEFYFRAELAHGSDAAAWLNTQINVFGGTPSAWENPPARDDHPLFRCPRWRSVFNGAGAVYQEARRPILRWGNPTGWPRRHQLVLASSLKNYNWEIEQFLDWIRPHLDMQDGDLLGYALTEGSEGEGDRDRPRLFFHNQPMVHT